MSGSRTRPTIRDRLACGTQVDEDSRLRFWSDVSTRRPAQPLVTAGRPAHYRLRRLLAWAELPISLGYALDTDARQVVAAIRHFSGGRLPDLLPPHEW